MANKFPLYLHATGQWAKTIRGKKYYFGSDKQAALKRYEAEREDLLRGRRSLPSSTTATIVELGNVYAAYCQQRVDQGKLAVRSRRESINTLHRLIEIVGKESQPSNWTAFDFDDIREALYSPVERTVAIRGGLKGPAVERRASTTVDGDIRRIKAFLNWCIDRELVRPLRFGDAFAVTSAKEKRQMRAAAGRRDMPADHIRAVLDKCSIWLKPLVLLGINGGIGNKDLGTMRLLDYDPESEWLELVRTKTAVFRRLWLWPETRQAIADYMDVRMTPFGDPSILFATKYRSVWYRDTETTKHDALCKSFTRARRLAGIERGTFYDLRRTFQTIGDETGDSIATKAIMAHAPSQSDMGSTYRQSVSDERLKKVCEHVRHWLFPTDSG
ncbi:MAG: hypothetical protein Aurels2KO_37090 [Aureliella sp.]